MDLQNKTEEELSRLVVESRVKLQEFRFAMAGSKKKNVKEGRALRKDIARVLTELRKKKNNNDRTK